MKIHVLCNDGSPLGVTSKTIWGDARRIGVGGAELALLTMCEEWQKRGDEVTLYNSPYASNESIFEQLPVDAFSPLQERDIVIIFRSPNPRISGAKGLKVWWSCDQYTIGSFSEFGKQVDKIVCISEFHRNYFQLNYGIQNSIVIDVPVRLDDYRDIEVNRVPYSLLFSSVPDRGLPLLFPIFAVVKDRLPDVTLTITSDYRLWGTQDAMDARHRMIWRPYYQDGVTYAGAVARQKLLEYQLQADLFVYPCIYDELFCISCAEASCAGAYPITSGKGALSTTNIGTVVSGSDYSSYAFKSTFADTILYCLENRDRLEKARLEIQNETKKRFAPQTILQQWDEKVFA